LNFPDTLHIKCITTNDYGDIFVGVGYNNEHGGVLRSTNEGMTWELVYDDGDNSILSIDIDDDGQIYAGSSNGLIPVVISTDNGDSWLSFNTPSGYNGNVTEIECVNAEVFISRWESGGGVLLRTNDYGNSWDSLFCCLNPSSDITSIKVDSLNDIIISTMGFQNNTGGVYKSTDDGVTWELLGLHNHQISGMDINANSEIFTCDWSLISGDNCGVNAWYSDSYEFELIQSGSGFADLKINSEGDIYACGTFGMIYSEDNGYCFQHYDTTYYSYIDVMHISSDDYIYIGHNSYLAKSALSTSTWQVSSREEYVSFYPNPASTNITLSKSIYSLQLHSLQGQLILKSSTDEKQFSLEGVASGVYVVTILEGDKVIGREKLIVR
jgi:hypothetical protein